MVIFKNTFTQVIRVFIRNLLLVSIVGVTSQYMYAANNYGGVKYDAKQIECLTRNTYEEARGESEKGKVAVIYTVLNRTKDDRFPSKPCAVIHSKGQFEWIGKAKPVKEHDTYQETKELVLEVLSGKHRDPTQGSLYFNSHHKQPKGTRCTIRIGNHSFYKPINKPIKKEKQL